jgi:hypothetical protein
MAVHVSEKLSVVVMTRVCAFASSLAALVNVGGTGEGPVAYGQLLIRADSGGSMSGGRIEYHHHHHHWHNSRV